MGTRASAWTVLVVTFVTWMGSRATSIALPLVALEQTGHAASTGLVLGCAALPLVTVTWWGNRFRERMRSGQGIAGALLVQAAGLTLVPIAAFAHRVSMITLCVSGLVMGTGAALAAPATRSLLADLGDQIGRNRAAQLLSWQDFAHRITMFLAPPLAAVAVGAGHTYALLWSEGLAVISSALLIRRISAASPSREPAPPSTAPRGSVPLSRILIAYPRLAASIAIHATSSTLWFAFSLGLTLLGVQIGQPGILVAAGMAGYGIASTAAAPLAAGWAGRMPPWPTTVLPCVLLGCAYAALPFAAHSPLAIGLIAAAGGVLMPFGIAAHNRLLSGEPSPGPERRAAFLADSVLDGGGGAAGMLCGGAVIGLIGASSAMRWAGTIAIVASLGALAWPHIAPDPSRRLPGLTGLAGPPLG